jgi:hypothetical protein
MGDAEDRHVAQPTRMATTLRDVSGVAYRKLQLTGVRSPAAPSW